MRQRTSRPQFPSVDAARVAETWKRRVLLEEDWSQLLRDHMRAQLGHLRAQLAGEPDVSANILANGTEQTCSIYDQPPTSISGDKPLIDLMERGGWWETAGQHERYVRALRESLVFVGWDSANQLPYYRLVTPDMVTIDPSPTNPTRPGVVWEASLRPIPDSPGELAWYWDRWTADSFQIWTGDRKRDVTAQFGDPVNLNRAAELKDEDGRPILRWALYHAAGGGAGIWRWAHNSEVSFGTLQVGLLWTAAVHGMLRASWDQRVILNGQVQGGEVSRVGGTEIRTVTPDPTRIYSIKGEGAAIAAWGASIDIEKAERFCRLYEARLAVHFGMSPADLVIESLNPASGASITVSQTGKRRLALREAPHFRRGDRELARITAAVARAHGVECSSAGWSARYPGVALTIDERARLSPTILAELSAGLLDRTAAYQELHPGTDRADAAADLEEFALAAELAAAKATATAGPGQGASSA